MRYIEIVISEDKTEIFHEGKQVITTTSSEELSTALNKLRKENDIMGYTYPLIISATSSTPFKTIVERIRTAANTGIYQILFLIHSDQNSDPRVVFTDLASMGHPLPEIEPYFLHITSEGHIYSGIGTSRTRLDSNNQDQKLDKLTNQLELFIGASKSAGYPNPPCQIFADPQASYQRFIDLISLSNKYNINPFIIDILDGPAAELLTDPR